MRMVRFFCCENGEILDTNGVPFLIKGMGVSGVFQAESYMWGFPFGDHLNTSSQLKTRIEEIIGSSSAETFWNNYRASFLTNDDIQEWVDLGANTVRLPFNYRMLSPEDQEGVFDEAGFQLLDQMIERFKNLGLYIILDMHACPGGAASENSGDPEHLFWVDMGGWWQQYVIDNLWNARVNRRKFKNGLNELVANLSGNNCNYKPGYYESLFDPFDAFGVSSMPFTQHVIPGTIHCVEYDVGNQDVAYYDTVYKNEIWLGEDGNKGRVFRSDGVDIFTTSEGCGYKVSYTDSGEWLRYTVNIAQDANYTVDFRIATGMDGTAVSLLLDGNYISGQVNMPNTGGWENWQTVGLGNPIWLTAGTHVLELRIVSGGVDLSNISFTTY